MLIPAHIREAIRDLRGPLFVLVSLIVVFILLYVGNFFSGDWDTDVFGNLATELVGVFITFLLLESYISHREKKLSDHRRKIALRSMSMLLSSHLGTIFTMFKATSIESPSEPVRYTEVCKFFDDKFLNTIIYLDFSAKAPVIPSMTWGEYLVMQFKQFHERLENAADKFGAGLTPEDVDLIEQLINSTYARMLMSNFGVRFGHGKLAMLLDVERGGSINFASVTSQNEFYGSIRSYHQALCELVLRVNEVIKYMGKEPIRVIEAWGDHHSPGTGSARCKVDAVN
jgi:hypothetical protein